MPPIDRQSIQLLFLLIFLISNIGIAQETKTLIAFGDSTTAPRGELKIYAGIIQRELPQLGLPVRVVNAGVGGQNTDQARARFQTDVLDHNPDMVVIQFGINDAAVDVWKDPHATKPRVAVDRYVENLRYFVRTLQARKVHVILMTPNPIRWTPGLLALYGKPPYLAEEPDGFNILLHQYADAVRQIAKSQNVPLVDVDRRFRGNANSEGKSIDALLLDGMHPNDQGHQLIADELIAELLNLELTAPSLENSDIEIRVLDNPTPSSLTDPKTGTTTVRFEDYVSNPPPKYSDPVEGWVAKFPVPFTGLVQPTTANTTVAPLPDPVGLLVESSSDSVGFFDPSSQFTCADPRADKLVFRFVDPANTHRAATVSRVAFRITGSSLTNGNVRYSLYDLSGRTLYSGSAVPNPDSRNVDSEVDCTAWMDGEVQSLIHKVVVEHSGAGYFVVGGVLRSQQPDLSFDGFRVREEDVSRQPGEQIAFAHSSQWQNVMQAERWTDMTLCRPEDALSQRREHAKWKVFEYETEDYSGKCLSVGRESSAPDLTLRLHKEGWHAVYVGLSTITDLNRPAKNKLEVKLTNDPAYTRLSNRLDLASPRRDVLEEIFLGVADLTDNDLHFSRVNEMPARIHYVTTIPLSESEIATVLADRTQKETRTSVATFDGFTWIHPFRPQSRSDLAATFSGYRDSDFKTWWFQVGGADLVHHPTQVGNLMGGQLDTFPRSVDRDYVESVRLLHNQGIDPLRVAVEEAHAQEAEILICLRAAGWKGAAPWEEFFSSEFYEAHPQWRCVDYDGTPTMHMSYAVEEVQDHLLDVYREVLQREPDGAGFLFHRGMPMLLWEEAFCQRFVTKYGEDPRKLAEDDPRVFELRAEIITGFLRKIRALLDKTATPQGNMNRRLKLAVTTFATADDNRKFGLDVETWIDEKLIDQIGIAWFAFHTSGLKTKSGDTAYYARITEGTDVKIYPFYVGWKMNSAADLLSNVAGDYDNGADGIAVWDPSQFEAWQSGKHTFWPIVSKLGHREKIRDGSLLFKPNATPLTRLGTNHYSRWFPNTGF